jgi:hypothetical protein
VDPKLTTPIKRECVVTLLLPAALNQAFIAALGSAVVGVVDQAATPLELKLAPPFPSNVRVYLFNATNPPGGRPTPEHKIQLIVPRQSRGTRGNFDFGDGANVLLVGKVEDEEAWVLWDATMHLDFAYSKNVQVKTAKIVSALQTRALTIQLRRLPQRGQETVIAAPTTLLGAAIRQRLADSQPLPNLTAATPLRTGGRPYVTPTRSQLAHEDRSQVFMRDPDKIDRATKAHMDTQDRLAEVVQAHGLDPLSPNLDDPDFDIAWRNADVAYPTEVKSLTEDNEEKQLRLGLGQVLRYAQRLAWEVSEVQPVLAVERKPTDDTWIDLCAQLGVTLTWPKRFEQDLFGDE